jgi:hypothetical protein
MHDCGATVAVRRAGPFRRRAPRVCRCATTDVINTAGAVEWYSTWYRSAKCSTSRPRPRSEGMAPGGAALETSARHSPGVSSQVGTQPSPTRALFAFTHVDGTGRSGPAAASPMGRPMVSAGDEVSASLLARFATASDIGLCWQTGCPPGYGGSRLRAWHTGATLTTSC